MKKKYSYRYKHFNTQSVIICDHKTIYSMIDAFTEYFQCKDIANLSILPYVDHILISNPNPITEYDHKGMAKLITHIWRKNQCQK